MRDYSSWYQPSQSDHTEKAFDMCNKTDIKINNSTITYESIINNANEWQKDVDIIVLIKKSDYSDIKIGDIISFDGKNYLVNFPTEDRDLFMSAKARLSTITLNYYKNNVLFSVPAIVPSGTINIIGTLYSQTSANTYELLCPNGYIEKDDTGLRFIIKGSAYKIDGVDPLKYNGLTLLKLIDDGRLEDDNLELNIANYYSNQVIYEITILNGVDASLLYTNQTLQLSVSCKKNNIIDSNPTVTYSSNDTYVATISNTGLITTHGTGDAIITTTYNGVSDFITLSSVQSIEDNYDIVITPTDNTLKISRSLVLTATANNNGIVDNNKHFVWTLNNIDRTSNTYATIIDNDKTCTITASNLSANANKFILIRSSFSYDSLIYTEKEIKIINLI